MLVFGTAFYSLYGRQKPAGSTPLEHIPLTDEQRRVLAELEKEAQNTSNKHWQGEEEVTTKPAETSTIR